MRAGLVLVEEAQYLYPHDLNIVHACFGPAKKLLTGDTDQLKGVKMEVKTAYCEENTAARVLQEDVLTQQIARGMPTARLRQNSRSNPAIVGLLETVFYQNKVVAVKPRSRSPLVLRFLAFCKAKG